MEILITTGIIMLLALAVAAIQMHLESRNGHGSLDKEDDNDL